MEASIDLIETQQAFMQKLAREGRGDNTLKNYQADLRCFNEFWANNGRKSTLTQFTHQEVMEYAQYLEQKYPSTNSIRRRVQALRLYLDFLVVHHGLPSNAMKELPVAPKVLDAPHPTPFSALCELNQELLEKWRTTQALEKLLAGRNLILLALMYQGGAKVSDLARLERQDLMRGKEFKLLLRPPKRDPYSIPLPQAFLPILEEYEQLYLSLWSEGQGLPPVSLLFNANPFRILSQGLSARGIELIFFELTRAKEASFTPREIRQAGLFRWINQGQTEGLIKEWMGVAPDYSLKAYFEWHEKHPPMNEYTDLNYG